MLKRLQYLFLALVGLTVVLFALWSFLAGTGALWGAAVTAGIGYLTLLSRFLFRDPDAWTKRTLDRLWRVLLGTVGRAALACAAAGLALLGTGWVLGSELAAASRPHPVPVSVLPIGETMMRDLQAEPFEVAVTIPAAERLPPQQTRHGPVVFEVPPLGEETQLAIVVTHPAYERWSRTLSLREARRGVFADVSPKPVLAVTLRPDSAVHPEDFEVTAWPAADRDSTVSKRLGDARDATFVVAFNHDWLVRVTDTARQLRHLSPAIPVNQQVKSYLVDLNQDDVFRWEPLRIEAVRLAQVELTAEAATAAFGREVPDSVVERFLVGGLPSPGPVMVRDAFLLSYNPELKVPNWVGYRLRNLPDSPPPPRRFRPDPDLAPDASAQLADYRRSGYDRGNLVSISDVRRYGERAVDEANYLSAIAPQTPVLNRGAWLRIEDYGRSYVEATGQWVCIFAGPAFLTPEGRRPQRRLDLLTLGESRIAVPTHFFRVLVRMVEEEPEVLAFLVPNESELSPEPADYLVSLGRVEEATGLSFFPDIAPEQQPDRSRRPEGLWPLR